MKLVLVKQEFTNKDGSKMKVNHFYLKTDNGAIAVQIKPVTFNNDGDKASYVKLRLMVDEIKEL